MQLLRAVCLAARHRAQASGATGLRTTPPPLLLPDPRAGRTSPHSGRQSRMSGYEAFEGVSLGDAFEAAASDPAPVTAEDAARSPPRLYVPFGHGGSYRSDSPVASRNNA